MLIAWYNRFFGVFLALVALFISGCVTAPGPVGPVPVASNIGGVYHSVQRGQTLWRISKIYNIDLDELASANRIFDASRIEPGQVIFIPHRQRQEPVSNLSYGEDFIWPVKGKVVATFGQSVQNMVNKGINIQAYRGTDVFASRSGKVVFYCVDFRGFGKTLIIDHGDGIFTVYARNSQVLVKSGDTVNKGELISKIGSYGSDKSAYLHFEIRKSGVAQNPFFYLP